MALMEAIIERRWEGSILGWLQKIKQSTAKL